MGRQIVAAAWQRKGKQCDSFYVTFTQPWNCHETSWIPVCDACETLSIAGWWFGTFGLFFHILGMSTSQLTFLRFFRGVGQPPTRNCDASGTQWSSQDIAISSTDPLERLCMIQSHGNWGYVMSPLNKLALQNVSPNIINYHRYLQ